jgi:hypothetical protein
LAALLTGIISSMSMTDKVRQAIAAMRSLPSDQQEMVARAILDSAAQDEEWQLTDEQIAEVQRRTVNSSRKLFSIAEARCLRHLGA